MVFQSNYTISSEYECVCARLHKKKRVLQITEPKL